MPYKEPTDTQTEMKALAMLVRGDTHKSIGQELGISAQTVVKIRDRNPDTLAIMKNKLVEKQISNAAKILDKSHRLLDDQLSQVEDAEQVRREARREYIDGLIDKKEFDARLRMLPKASISDLTSVSREMFNQSQIEQGKPTSISGNPDEAKKQFLDLAEAIKAGDEVKLQQIIFNEKRGVVHEPVDESKSV